MNANLLHERVVGQLLRLVGEKLLGVSYWCLRGEASAEDILDPEFYLGGEVELRFTNTEPILITWDENAGWDDHFSVKAENLSTSLPDTLEPLDASATPQWRAHIGSPLIGCSVLGWNHTPHIIAFRFQSGTVLLGDGSRKDRFGDGDDILVRAEHDAAKLPGMDDMEALWVSGR